MLDIKFIRENPKEVKAAITNKQLVGTVDIDALLNLDTKYRNLLAKVETHRALKNQLSDNISKVAKEERGKLIEEATVVKAALQKMEATLTELKSQIEALLLWIPNIPASDVPCGSDETGNVVIRTEGVVPKFDFAPKDHLELGTRLGIIDVGRGVKVGGFRSYFLVNDGVELEQALLRFAADYIKKQGFEFYTVPWMVNREYLVGTGYFPWGEEDHYKTQDDQGLIGTAEVSLTSYYAGEVLAEDELPKKLAGVSPCFRREVGAHGKDTQGVFRVHQFTKVEQVMLLPEGEELSREWHETMLGYAEDILTALELPYHILLMCTGDMGAGQRKKYDIETWFPSQNKYRETHSDSYFLDFQARRLNIRYKTKTGQIKFVNTLNNTVAATPRLLAAVLENHQQKDGSVTVPKVLWPYMNKKILKAA
ncbi:MAG: Seryl-tRNA synthetase [candidate division WWE3 bacterium GW2011_GWA1_46_21]|uniref:Serine--tRNA ligase n=4 Tax=Katanobacteria TaxID=422282 RepID=A0A0G1PC74_UNCKA|nr:MAG: Seryl-tRNA synthetase [candidate division WWE3 bacterium GW2011_GWA1_46_21]KKU51318.1 MAG: Seryl-tRNA synthetase [candidate division WWE3 bacterium GW2011_GWC1_47_10]KKU57273.1 MAG: Seryl-tRNA synthetase [candidate division WWE3 bacterium GW2011_GWB1_47_11]